MRVIHGLTIIETPVSNEYRAGIEEWVAALRSGEYAQGKGCLRTPDNKFCCLGVVCDLAVKKGWADWVDAGNRYECVVDRDKGDMSWSTVPIGIESKLSPDAPLQSAGETSFIRMNDELNFTFGQIADVIEAMILGATQTKCVEGA